MSMKALVKKGKGKGQIELLDYPIPQVKEGDVLLRIEAAGICGSDLKGVRPCQERRGDQSTS